MATTPESTVKNCIVSSEKPRMSSNWESDKKKAKDEELLNLNLL
jgi:hypothetical protein